MMRSSPIHTRPTSTPANRKELPQTTTSKVNLNLLKIWPDIVPDIWCITKNKSLCFWQCGGCETFGLDLDPDPAFSLMRISDQNHNMSKFKQEFSKKLNYFQACMRQSCTCWAPTSPMGMSWRAATSALTGTSRFLHNWVLVPIYWNLTQIRIWVNLDLYWNMLIQVLHLHRACSGPAENPRDDACWDTRQQQERTASWLQE